MNGLSVLLMVATLAAWVRGYCRSDFIGFGRHGLNGKLWQYASVYVHTGPGDIGVVGCLSYADADRARQLGFTAGPHWGARWDTGPAHSARQRYINWHQWGRGRGRLVQGGGIVLVGERGRSAMWVLGSPVHFDGPETLSDNWYFAIPCWMPAAVFAFLPAKRVCAFACRRWRRNRAARGQCPACGYDLRATPDAGGPLMARCPECGWGSVR